MFAPAQLVPPLLVSTIVPCAPAAATEAASRALTARNMTVTPELWADHAAVVGLPASTVPPTPTAQACVASPIATPCRSAVPGAVEAAQVAPPSDDAST